jgi:hypothetical protein
MARQETRIADIGLPNKRGNAITRQKLRRVYRRFSRVNSPLWSDDGQLGDNPLGWKKRFEVIAMTQTRSYSL